MAMGATVLPLLADINPPRFLPSSRSVAYTRTAWEKAGRYPEWLDYCEDVIFDLNLKRMGLRFTFQPTAIAYFRPRSSLGAFFRQYYRYARGDGKAGLWPWRHLMRYSTYVLGPLALALGFWYKGLWLLLAVAVAMYLYRPYRRLATSLGGLSPVSGVKAILWVPVIRLVGDVAKMMGYPVGCVWRLRHRRSDA
jgi:cellulose synthase/poly-beta-1,6-N-acetylglucosamine synthase-like glycosyltransferase